VTGTKASASVASALLGSGIPLQSHHYVSLLACCFDVPVGLGGV